MSAEPETVSRADGVEVPIPICHQERIVIFEASFGPICTEFAMLLSIRDPIAIALDADPVLYDPIVIAQPCWELLAIPYAIRHPIQPLVVALFDIPFSTL